MKNEYEFYEQLLFGYVSYIKDFNTYLTKEYGLTDIPYHVAGKAFPKIGSVVINNVKVDYRWHGRVKRKSNHHYARWNVLLPSNEST
jgi:hypothetical protein